MHIFPWFASVSLFLIIGVQAYNAVPSLLPLPSQPLLLTVVVPLVQAPSFSLCLQVLCLCILCLARPSISELKMELWEAEGEECAFFTWTIWMIIFLLNHALTHKYTCICTSKFWFSASIYVHSPSLCMQLSWPLSTTSSSLLDRDAFSNQRRYSLFPSQTWLCSGGIPGIPRHRLLEHLKAQRARDRASSVCACCSIAYFMIYTCTHALYYILLYCIIEAKIFT